MFLLVRSAMCIGLVVSALPDRPAAKQGVAAFDTVADDAGGVAAAAIDRFCRRDPGRCLRAAASVATAAGTRPPAPARIPAGSGAALSAAGL